MQYLNDEQHYIDRYDLLTIKECLDTVKIFQKIYDDSLTDKKLKDLPKDEKFKGANQMLHWQLFSVKTREHKRKKETIKKWMDNDRIEQEKFDNTPAPQGVFCSDCKIPIYTTFKHLENYTDEPIRVLFFFKCPKCKKGKSIYEDGEERVSEPDLCPKCKNELKSKHTRKGQVITQTVTCPSCKFTKTEVDDLEKSHLEFLKEQEENKKLLEKHRSEFCLTDEKGKEHMETIEKIKYANETFEEEKQKYDSVPYQKTVQLKKTSIVDLEKLLTESLEKEKYVKLSFDKPEIGQFVFVPFTVQDSDSSRREYDSKNNLEKLITNVIAKTNWRLLSGSVHYRLGYVFGKLKGYEQEDDLMEIFGMKKKEQKSSKEDQERRMKYGSDNLVQLARLLGEHEGIESTRKKRLEHEPEGFFLNDGKGPYTCGICHEGAYGEDIWWNLDGLRCRDCWRNIQEKIIPPLKYDNDGVWIKEWEIHSEYGVHPATRRKLEREGLLKGRELKKKDGTVYCTVYLVSENKEFLKKYPKKLSMKVEFINSADGEKIQL